MQKEALNRILIVGDAGRGKTTLASKLSVKLGISNYSTDDFYHEVKFLKIRDREEAKNLIQEVFEEEKWIVEGTTQWLYEFGLQKADVIIHLEFKNTLVQWISLFRRYLGRDNETLHGLYKLMRHALYKKHKLGYRKGKPTSAEIVEPYKDKVITLSSFKEIDGYFNSL